jgi:hypothetical protein
MIIAVCLFARVYISGMFLHWDPFLCSAAHSFIFHVCNVASLCVMLVPIDTSFSHTRSSV